MGGNYTGLLQASKSICPYPLIAAQEVGMWPPDMPDSVLFFRFCYEGCCMPCPSQGWSILNGKKYIVVLY